uniref:Peroxidase n=1 Tax=Romanomermis culicivorax TaxID=13658 RepID=A0A915K5P0_ROMCU
MDIFNSVKNFNCAPQLEASQNHCRMNSCFNKKYRTMDGACNNPFNPLLGAAATPYLRLLGQHFRDGLSSPFGSTLPRPREISLSLLSTKKSSFDRRFNTMIMAWGQFVAHDMTHNSLSIKMKCSVLGCDTLNPECLQISVNNTDSTYGCPNDRCCIKFARAASMCGAKIRNNVNQNTAFIDGSQIYGSAYADSDFLRNPSNNNGMLRFSSFDGQMFLPFHKEHCSDDDEDNNRNCEPLFDTGDNRNKLFLGLAALHTLFLREHNRLVKILKNLNPKWTGEKLFQFPDFAPRDFLGGGVDIDSILKSMMNTPIKKPQSGVSHRLIEQKLENIDDLAAVNIQRGRDAGMPPYNRLREFCGLKRAAEFQDFSNEISDLETRKKMEELYKNPDDVDSYVGLLLEDAHPGGLVGPTTRCIIIDQFKRIRDGDRFWYQNAGSFTKAQLLELERVSLARILCDNGDRMDF